MTQVGIAYETAIAAWHASAPAAPQTLDLAVPELLKAFHPDQQPGAMVPLTVGPNAGASCPAPLAELLQSDSILEDVDLAGAPTIDGDVLILGGGGAGCVAALTAARAGARVLLATKLRLGDSNTVMAEGGIQAAVGPDDSLQRHFEDTLRAGHFVGHKELVSALVSDGPEAIRWLIQEGMSFDLTEGSQRMGGKLSRKKPGGATAARLLSYRDFTGLELMRALREAVLQDLARGVPILARASATILATGGAGRLHLSGFPTSNHYGATADGLVLAYRLGAQLSDIDSFQYHPTGIAWPSHMEGSLVSEAARSSGAFLVNGHGNRFVDELQPRDIVASAILREIQEGRGVVRDQHVGIFLDTPSLEKSKPGILEKSLVTLKHLAHRAGIDPAKEPFLIRPTLHYQNGGVLINPDGQTAIPGLFCAGEVTGGIHGRNRMMGNALLELVVFGRRAGAAAARTVRKERPHTIGLTHLADWRRALVTHGFSLAKKSPILFPPYGNFDITVDREKTA